jgi:hypothetical protein
MWIVSLDNLVVVQIFQEIEPNCHQVLRKRGWIKAREERFAIGRDRLSDFSTGD